MATLIFARKRIASVQLAVRVRSVLG